MNIFPTIKKTIHPPPPQTFPINSAFNFIYPILKPKSFDICLCNSFVLIYHIKSYIFILIFTQHFSQLRAEFTILAKYVFN